MQKDLVIGLLDEEIGFAVQPILTCTHYTKAMLSKLSQKAEQLKQELFTTKCTDCDSTKENWICLECREIKCSRYVNGHMALHNQSADHQIGLSLRDLSLWCYKCDSYITSENITKFQKFVSKVKFMDNQPLQDELDKIIQQLAKLDFSETQYKYDDFVNGLRDNKFKKIVFLTGAGISVAAGIPDFRSPGGLYSTLAQFNLPKPEAVFDIQYFQQQPQAFYAVAKGFLNMKGKPVLAHQFQKILQDRNQLLRVFTQNIDGLELDAGVKQELLIQAHGHMRTAHCLKCKEEGSMKTFFEHLEKQEIYICSSCKEGYVKPDVVFFGEGLPKEYFEHINDVKQADLIIVMGTSLKVQPFASSVLLAKKEVPIVLINRENVLPKRDNTLFIEGDIEENIHKILEYIHKK